MTGLVGKHPEVPQEQAGEANPAVRFLPRPGARRPGSTLKGTENYRFPVVTAIVLGDSPCFFFSFFFFF